MVFKRIAGPWRQEPGKRQRRGSWTNVRHCSWTAFLFPSVFSQKVTGGSVLLKLGLWNIGSALLPWQPLSAPNSFSFLKIKCSFSKYLPPPAPPPRRAFYLNLTFCCGLSCLSLLTWCYLSFARVEPPTVHIMDFPAVGL